MAEEISWYVMSISCVAANLLAFALAFLLASMGDVLVSVGDGLGSMAQLVLRSVS